MKLKIIGSGGCVSIPRPLCQCSICTEARKKGFPYARCGCSLYIEDVNILIDSPEDIAYALNNADIKNIDYILYSHIDPDHTMGMRVIEQLRLDWLANSIGTNCKNPITVASLPPIIKDLKCQGTKYGSALDYYESMNLINIRAFSDIDLASLHIDLVPVDESARVTVFVFTEGLHKVIYAPCDVKPFPENDIFMDADCLIIGDTIVADILKGGFVLGKDNPLRDELFVMDEVIGLKNKYHIKRVIITHLEEDWGKSYDDYRNLQKQLDGIEFAYDGLEIIF
ncbi:phosphoribosyl 1,2-cyclic phosphate phosphodiesterase [Kineothrix alysoides]|uniref:Phosphoribosyl 1,2-cyclic phosphate phosphodiesterase n=1 Tax=Kineothrix alysoides TaxID=1469948 RepID=A0A4R1R4W4_9FIRM|nr:hypothetical protein [Kineothrix alysoides]TCL60509.1 phosphoribosyl 1,2-cyclic phosphate phosphodiesterase [Kineothrix alysoides]